jgi:hypothetical protein
MAVISRFNSKGKSVANDLYRGVENGTIRITDAVEANGLRLDHLAYEYYGDGLNWWIIAAANGIRWPLGIGSGNANRESPGEKIILFIPNVNDVLNLLK